MIFQYSTRIFEDR